MSRTKLLMEIKEDAENLASSIGILLTDLESDEESRLGHTAKIRELLEKYGAKKLSEIEPSNYEDLIADVEKL